MLIIRDIFTLEYTRYTIDTRIVKRSQWCAIDAFIESAVKPRKLSAFRHINEAFFPGKTRSK